MANMDLLNPFEYHKTVRSAAAAWTVRGAAVVGMMGVPMGPFGALAGLIIGGVGALCIGFIHDAITVRSLKNEVTAQVQRLEHLVRWTEFVFSESEHPGLILMYLCREFEGLCNCETKSRTRTNLMESLATLLRREDVQAVATQYLEMFFQDWRKTGAEDINSFKCVINVCTTAFEGERKVPVVYESMRALRSNEGVQQLLASVSEKEDSRSKWVTYADLSNTTVDHLFRSTLLSKFKPGQVKRALSKALPSNVSEGADTAIASNERRLRQSLKTEPPIPWVNELALHDTNELLSEQMGDSEEGSWEELPSVPDAAKIPVPSEAEFAIAVKEALPPPQQPLTTDASERRESRGLSTVSPNSVSVPNPTPPSSSQELDVGGAPRSTLLLAGETLGRNVAKINNPFRQSVEGCEAPARQISSGLIKIISPPGVGDDANKEGSKTVSRIDLGMPRTLSPGAKPAMSVPVIPEVTKPKVIEKRFFKDFNDFKNFDTDLKHKIPIGATEFDLLNEFIPEEPLGAWQLAVKRGVTRVYKQIVNVGGSDLVMVKAYSLFEGISIECMIFNLRDLSRRTKWDKTFDNFTLVEGDVFGNEITYNSIHAPWPVADREFLQWRRIQYITDDGHKSCDGDDEQPATEQPLKECRIMHRSAEHPGYPIPKTSNIIRAESVISAYAFTKASSGTELMLLTQCDIKGVVPKWMVNAQAAKAPVQWLDNFKAACQESMKMYGNKFPEYKPKPQFTNAIRINQAFQPGASLAN